MSAELPAKMAFGFDRSGEDEQAAGVLVQPMHGPHPLAAGKQGGQGIGKRRG